MPSHLIQMGYYESLNFLLLEQHCQRILAFRSDLSKSLRGQPACNILHNLLFLRITCLLNQVVSQGLYLPLVRNGKLEGGDPCWEPG